MKDPLKRITIVFVIVALLPVALIVYQLRLISTDEKIVREAYQNQLDAILYSVNQYSDDVISDWAINVRVEAKQGLWDPAFRDRLTSAINQLDVVRYIYLADSSGQSLVFDMQDSTADVKAIQLSMDQLIANERERVNKLVEYERAGFRKLDAIDLAVAENQIPILFAMDKQSPLMVGALIVDLPRFIQSTLAPKMQGISKDKFIISAMRVADDSLVYSTDPEVRAGSSAAAEEFKDQVQQRDFWILPGYFLGISLKGATIDDLVETRTTTTEIFLAFLGIMLTAGIFFLYSNIRREIQLSQAKSEFVSNVSHEIRTPLSLIGMFAETLETGRVTTEEKKQEYYSIIGKETSRLTKIVNRILNFSQLEANRKRFRFELIDLNSLCAEILRSYFHHLEDKGFAVDFHPDPKMEKVRIDKDAVTEVIVNLLDNAVKYSRERKHIAIRTGMSVGNCFIEVQDEGIGIQRTYQKEVFEQFFRAPTGDVHTTKGTGLGLTLVKKIMEAHHGTVELSSAPGKGSTFRVNFPLNTKHRDELSNTNR
jgi:two-component system phosphate regulon sensor histidine kinase PhoR